MVLLYFGYASNMLTERMKISCPAAKEICIAKLKDFKLAFSGYSESWKGAKATIVESPGDCVWGVIWEIPEDMEEDLDREEDGYKSISVSVNCQDNSELLCKCYQKITALDDCNEPSLVYKTVIVSGAKEHQLPKMYIQHLEAFKDNGYKGSVEIAINIKV